MQKNDWNTTVKLMIIGHINILNKESERITLMTGPINRIMLHNSEFIGKNKNRKDKYIDYKKNDKDMENVMVVIKRFMTHLKKLEKLPKLDKIDINDVSLYVNLRDIYNESLDIKRDLHRILLRIDDLMLK